MAFDFTYFATRQANSRSRFCASVGFFRVTAFSAFSFSSCESLLCTSRPPPTRL